jgi:hypothetical protein
VQLVHVLLIRPLRVRDLEAVLEGSRYWVVGIAGGGTCYYVVRRGTEKIPPPGEVKEVKRMVRHVPVIRRRVLGWAWVEISDEDLDHIETALWPAEHSRWINNCSYNNGSAMVYYYHCPSGRTYTVHTPNVMNGPSWLHSWCLTSEWVPPPPEPKREHKPTVWPTSTAEPVIQITRVKPT